MGFWRRDRNWFEEREVWVDLGFYQIRFSLSVILDNNLRHSLDAILHTLHIIYIPKGFMSLSAQNSMSKKVQNKVLNDTKIKNYVSQVL